MRDPCAMTILRGKRRATLGKGTNGGVATVEGGTEAATPLGLTALGCLFPGWLAARNPGLEDAIPSGLGEGVEELWGMLSPKGEGWGEGELSSRRFQGRRMSEPPDHELIACRPSRGGKCFGSQMDWQRRVSTSA